MDAEHISAIKQGVEVWNAWKANKELKTFFSPDLAGANLSGANLYKANFSNTDLSDADLSNALLDNAFFFEANLSGVNLASARLPGATFFGACAKQAILTSADLHSADFKRADLTGANLSEARLRFATLVETNLTDAILTDCRVYGISAWNLTTTEGTKQNNLIITAPEEPRITVDNIEVAQFVHLLLNRKKLRDVLNTVTSKAVLILGRFTPERKAVLDALADELRKNNLLPIIFDFERSTNRDFTETIKILAGLSLFVIVDITKPKSVSQELTAVVPDYQIPFVPILEEGESQYSMFGDFKKYDWVLRPIRTYRTKEELLVGFSSLILEPAWRKHVELQGKKNEQLQAMSMEEMIKQKKTI